MPDQVVSLTPTPATITPDYAVGVHTSPLFNDPLMNVPVDSVKYETSEVGQSGTLNYGGFLDTEEWIGELKWYQLYKTIDYMRTDAVISAIEKGFFLPIERANISFAYDNPELIKDQKYQMILDFIKKDFQKFDWPTFLHNALLFIPYGFSMFEIIYKQDDNGYLHVERLAPRLPKTAWRWIIDGHGYLRIMQQLVYTPNPDGSNGAWKYIPIPAEKLLLITGQREGANYTGRSEYRPFYREWLVKDNTLKQIIITIKRVGGGVPYARINKEAPERTTPTVDGNVDENQGAVQQWRNMLQKLAGGENAYIAGKWLDELGLFTVDPGALQGLLDVCRYTDQSIAKCAFQMFMNLGSSGESGNRALGETFEGLYYQGENGKMARIASAFSAQVVKRVIDLNFGPQEYYPVMHGEIEQDIGEMMKTLSELKRFNLIEGNTDLENWLYGKWALPRTTTENKIKIAAPKGAGGFLPMSEKNIQLGDIKRSRAPRPNERHMDVDGIEGGLNGLKNQIALEARKIVEPDMINLANQLVMGIRPYLIQHPMFGNRLADTFRKYYKQFLDQAKGHVKKELVTQNIKLVDRILLADKSKTPSASQAAYEKWFNEQANIDSELLWGDAKSAVYKYYATGKAQGMDGEELKDFVVDSILAEAGQRYASAAGQVLNAYGTVREISSQEFQQNIKSKIRSGIFDGNICEYCADQDGTEYVWDNDEQDYIGPMGEPAPDLRDSTDNPCEGYKGGNSCRCIYVYNVGGDDNE